MKTSELTGVALDWAVAKCLPTPKDALGLLDLDVYNGFNPSTNWAQAGPIIERERIQLRVDEQGSDFAVQWVRSIWCGPRINGPTPLVAAMRCFVASKLGDDIEIPEELNECQ